MKKNLLLAGLFTTFSLVAKSQVGVNTATPTATLDVTAKNSTGTGSAVEGILIPRVDRQKAQSMTGVPVSTMIYVNSIATGTAAGTAVNMDTVGYYYYDGTVWTKLNTPVNMYNADGTLTGNRTVTQGANTLAFTGTQTNAFSVDGNTLSVDAANKRVGIGTTAPATKLDIGGNLRIGTVTGTNGATNVTALVRDNTTGEVKISTSPSGNTAALNYIVFTLSNVQGDWVSDYDTKISAANFSLIVVGVFFDRQLAVGNPGTVEPIYSSANVYAFTAGTSTWHLGADFPNTTTQGGLNGTWYLTCLVINNSIAKGLPGVTQNFGGSNTAAAATPPPGL